MGFHCARCFLIRSQLCKNVCLLYENAGISNQKNPIEAYFIFNNELFNYWALGKHGSFSSGCCKNQTTEVFI